MSEITKLNPQNVWKNFYALTQIPRPSKHEAKVVAYLKDFGEKLGLETIVDETGNVIIRKPATKGMENRAGVILQGHVDMVPQKNNAKKHDFTKDPIETIIDGDWVRANETTLGADNGMGCAAAMAVLESKDIAHGPIECLFTVDEETGMTGANHLKAGVLNGKILINMDSETEGELYVGCAGGVDVNINKSYKEVPAPEGYEAYKVCVGGLNGGHSGMDINIGRANANKLLVRFLNRYNYKYNYELVEIEGGNMRNAIPREAYAIIMVPRAEAKTLKAEVANYQNIYREEFKVTEKNLSFTVEKVKKAPTMVVPHKTAVNIIKATFVCPNGVVRMSDSMPGLVETSNNLAIIEVKGGKFSVKCLTRSSVNSAKEGTMFKIGTVFDLIGAKAEFTGEYPGWNPNMESPIMNTMKTCYKKLYKKEPKIMAIHAGLECGLFGSVYDWDMVSFGPTIEHPHSPDERVNIESVGRFWNLLVEVLKNIPKK